MSNSNSITYSPPIEDDMSQKRNHQVCRAYPFYSFQILNLFQINDFLLHELSRTIMIAWQKYWKLDPFRLLKTFNTI